MTLQNLSNEAATCQQCVLGQTRQCIVFGEGNTKASLMLVGEAPGAKEDESGRPFVGAAGQILDEMLGKIGLRREDIYITSVIKCRPPKNRFPKKAEVAACLPFLQRQIELIKPRLIVCMGNLATKTLIDPKAKITEIHGRMFERGGVKLMAIYHPAAILYDRQKLGAIEEDFYRVKEILQAGSQYKG